MRCSESDLEALFRVTEDEVVDMITALVTAVHRLPPPMTGSENSLIQFWDDNIRTLLSLAFSEDLAIRDSNQGTSTALCRPDFGFIINGVCVFRGEEKPKSFTGTHPRQELLNKLDWTYDPALFIVGQCLLGLIHGCMTHRIRRVSRCGARLVPRRDLTFEGHGPLPSRSGRQEGPYRKYH